MCLLPCAQLIMVSAPAPAGPGTPACGRMAPDCSAPPSSSSAIRSKATRGMVSCPRADACSPRLTGAAVPQHSCAHNVRRQHPCPYAPAPATHPCPLCPQLPQTQRAAPCFFAAPGPPPAAVAPRTFSERGLVRGASELSAAASSGAVHSCDPERDRADGRHLRFSRAATPAFKLLS